ncbi:MAG: RidA family protein [Candidatus Aminicenantes bacterium]|nr:RidA family protein [Candidatus Aminicenantes bacterium]
MKTRSILGLALPAAALSLFVAAASQGQGVKKEILTDKAPKAIGPYSQGIAAGGFVFCSGQLGTDPATGKLVEGGIEAETRQVLKNLAAVLEAAGTSLDDVVKCTVYLADMAEFGAMNKVYAEFFKAPFPARATTQVAGLAMKAKVEIDAVAVVRRGSPRG